jgi:hypothetical protein
MTKNPTEDPAFQKTLKNLLSAKPKPHSEMKVGKTTAKNPKSHAKRGVSAKPKTA